MGLLVAGLHLLCCWRYLVVLVEAFDTRGLDCLWQIWATTAFALIVGRIAKYFTPVETGPAADDELLDAAVADLSSSIGSNVKCLPYKEGRELTAFPTTAPAAHGADISPAAGMQREPEDDVAAIKRRAQEEEAARLAQYRMEVQQMLADIRRQSSSSSRVDGRLLYRLADQLFGSSINMHEFLLLGGVPVIAGAIAALARALDATQQQQQQHEVQAAVPEQELYSLLQASWVLLQVSHGSPACKAAIQDPDCSAALLAAARAVLDHPAAAGRAEPVLRNVWWTLLNMCDTRTARTRSSSGGSSSSQGRSTAVATSAAGAGVLDSFHTRLLQQYQEVRAVNMLQQLVSLRHGLSAGWVAAAHLGLLMQLGHQQQQPPPCSALQDLSAAAVEASLQEDSISGLGYLLVHMRLELAHPPPELQQQQLSSAIRGLVEGSLHFLLSFHSQQLLQLLVEQQLLGCFAAHSCQRLGRLLVCTLLSSKGQQVLAAVEEGYKMDVPLALAQAIPMKLHVKLPAVRPLSSTPAEEQQPAAAGEIEPAGEGTQTAVQQQQQQQQAIADDMFTDILACRLLLQQQRLWELLSGFCEELQVQPGLDQQPQQEVQQGGGLSVPAAVCEQECGVVAAVVGLIHHLMSRDLQLQAAQHLRGDSVQDSLSSRSSRSSRSLQEALAMPDPSGTYSRVVAGLVQQQQLPVAAAAGSGSGSAAAQPLSLPGLPGPACSSEVAVAAAAAAAAPTTSSEPKVVFKFGQLEHEVDAAVFRDIRRCSKLVHSILCRVPSSSSSSAVREQQPVVVVTALAVPQFTDEGNCWVVQCLQRWVTSKALDGFSVLEAAKLWVAADFLQVDELQVACEDLIASGFKQDAQAVTLAVELCARHTESGARLLRLAVQEVLRRISAAEGSRRGGSSRAQQQQQQQQQDEPLQMLRRLLEQHTALLLPAMHGELRDRLVTLCMVSAGLDAEDPADAVG